MLQYNSINNLDSNFMGDNSLPDFDSYQKLSDEQRHFHNFMTMQKVDSKLDDIKASLMNKADNKDLSHLEAMVLIKADKDDVGEVNKKIECKASKWVEHLAIFVLSLVGVAIVGAIMSLIIL